MLSVEKKKALEELSSEMMRYVLDQVEICKGEEMMNDLSVGMSTYLNVISDMDNPTLSEIAAKTKRSKPSVTIAIDKLEDKEYVKRVQSEDDRRSFHIHLTEKGRRFAEVKNTYQDRIHEKISNTLTDEEIDQLIALSSKIFK